MIYVILEFRENEPATPRVYGTLPRAQLAFDDMAAEYAMQVISEDPEETPELLANEPSGTIAVAGDDVHSLHLFEVSIR